MDRDGFLAHLRAGETATSGVEAITGIKPEIVTIASWDILGQYIRKGVMVAGPLMAAIVSIELLADEDSIEPELMARIKSGEPTGAVLSGMGRRCRVVERGLAIQAFANLIYKGHTIGNCVEVFTETLFREGDKKWL